MSIPNQDYIRLEKAYSTILALEKKVEALQNRSTGEPIAVVGIGCKFPGEVNSTHEFYNMLKRGVNAIVDIPEQRWNFDQYDRKLRNKIYCRKGGFLSDVYDFDPLFFNISPLEAEYMDPQQRIFLETCWKAFEDAGYTTDKLMNVRCGVFAGVVSNDYYTYIDSIPHSPEAYEVMGNYNSMLSGRIAYFLNLKGPAITIDTACSSSAVALLLACKAIQNGDSDIALAGGVTLYITPRPYLLMCESLMLSKSGQCYAFDDRADGFIPGEGCGVVVLKSLKKAEEDGDQIYGVIYGSGTNQDGKSNGITAPNALSQTELQLSVFNRYNINPEDISYIETHGTGTKLGDPIEIQALTEAFRKHTDKKQFCAIGSVKTNIGHLQAAAGVASLIKILLSMRNGCLLPSINYQAVNRHIALNDTPFFVNTRVQEWKVRDGIPRIAAMNSFGFSGTNAHMIVQEYTAKESVKYTGPYLIPLSANSKETLKKYAGEVKRFIESNQEDQENTLEICNRIRSCVASVLHVSAEDIDDNVDWDMIGLEPFALQQMADKLNAEINLTLSISELANVRNIKQLADYLLRLVENKTTDDFISSLAFTLQTGRNAMKIRELFVAGNKKELAAQLGLFLEDKLSTLDIQLSREAEACKQNWKNGGNVDWSTLYPYGKPYRISAPTYPFEKREYILKPDVESKKQLSLHAVSAESCDEYVINKESSGYSSHKVRDNEILPGAYFIELMVRAAMKVSGNEVNCLKNVYFKNPLYIEKGDVKVHLISRIDQVNHTIACKVVKKYAQQEYEYSLGELSMNKRNGKSAPVLHLGNTAKAFDKSQWYAYTRQKGFLYGEKYQAVERVNLYTEEVVAAVSMESLNRTEDEYSINPYLLDAAIQPVIALMETEFPSSSVFLPYHIEELYVYHPITDKITSYIKKSKVEQLYDSSSKCYYVNLYISDENNRLLLECRNLGIKVIDSVQSSVKSDAGEIRESIAPIVHTVPSTVPEVCTELNQNEMQIGAVQNYLKETISSIMKIPVENIEPDRPFPSLGIDSFLSLKFLKILETDIGRLPKTILFEHFNVEKLSEYLHSNFPENFRKQMDATKKSVALACSDTQANTAVSSQRIPERALLIPESELDRYPAEKEHIARITNSFEMEGLAYARKEIAPLIFLGANRESFFYIAERDNIVLAFLYNGPLEALDALAEELAGYCLAENKRVYFLLEHNLKSIKNRELGSTVIGVLQRLEQLPPELGSKKYRHLRYAISHFQKAGNCHVQEYRINSAPDMDEKIISIIDQWCASKKMVNQYIQKVKDQILTKAFPGIYRFFLTFLDDELISVIVITPIPACNGYLMDLEFYPPSMPLGGLEYSIYTIYQKLQSEGINFFSLGATFGVAPDSTLNNDPIWANEMSELWSQGIFDGSGNYQFKNKFRTMNHSLKLYRFLDSPEDNLIDIIMFIANPSGMEEYQSTGKEALPDNAAEARSLEHTPELDYSKLQPFHYNTLFVPQQEVEYDFLTDSWSELAWTQSLAMNQQSSVKFTDYDLIRSLQSVFPFTYIVPVASGRYAEAVLFEALPKGKNVIPQNMLFPTTVQNQVHHGFEPLEIPADAVYDLHGNEIFRGNIDPVKLEAALQEGNVAYVSIEVENNAAGGAPVSLQNLQDVRSLCNRYGAWLIIDATRVIENALFLIDQGCSNQTPLCLTNEILSYADYIVASLTKDFSTPVGGIIATNDAGVYNRISERLSIQGSGLNIINKQLICSALADTDRIIKLVIERKRLVQRLGTALKDVLPLVTPFGGHCLLVEPGKIKGLENFQYPAQSFLNWLFLKTGIRAGVHSGGLDIASPTNGLIRLAIPVGCKEKDMDEIAGRIRTVCWEEADLRDITLMQKGESSFGMIKNKYQVVEKTCNRSPNVQEADTKLCTENDGLVAIVGVSGRYPEAENLYQFWSNLKNKKDCIVEIPKERWNYQLFYHPDKREYGKNPCKWGGFIKDADKFDPQFFQITPYEAEKMDPQQRLFLQTAWQLIEDAGYALSDFKAQTDNNVGVFVGATWSEYSYLADADKGFYPEVNLGSIATRVAYQLGLQGPTLTVDTHCSSSLSALYLAYESVKNGACKAAIAGGVNLSLHPNKYQFAKYFLSPTGRCHSFGAGGDGYVPSEGVGAVLLKPLHDAIKSNDHIYGVINGVLMRHAGKTAGATVPNPRSQADLIRDVYKQAKINPETISYVEAHGTGTELGDPIEIESLTSAFSLFTDKKQFCSIGSVKSNIGHLEAAAGISQLTKVLLQFKYKKLLPSLHSEKINPNIEFEATPFFVQRELADWKLSESAAYPRRAAISSFGAGGVNCHCVLEEFPNEYSNQGTGSGQRYLFPLSARSKGVLLEYVKAFHEFLILEGHEIPLQNIAYTLQIGRETFREKVGFIASSVNELKELCSKYVNGQLLPQIVTGSSLNPETNKNVSIDTALPAFSDKPEEYARYWINGKRVDWNTIFDYRQAKRVPLPAYPFEKESYWAPCSETGLQAKNLFLNAMDGNISINENDRTFCYQKLFRAVPCIESESVNDRLVVFDNNDSAFQYLTSKGYNTVLVKQGEKFASGGACSFTVNPHKKQDLDTLWTELFKAKGDNGITIVYLWGNQTGIRAWEGYSSLITSPLVNVCSSLNKYALKDQVNIICGLQTGNTYEELFHASLEAFFKTLQLENCNFRIKIVSCCSHSDFYGHMLRELGNFHDKVERIKYIGNNRHGAFYEPLDSENVFNDNVLRNEGVYIITGGAKGIGYCISQYLASTRQARLVLVGRSNLDSDIADRMKLLEKQGGKAVYIQADISNKNEVEKVIKTTKDTFTTINGIIHSAGIIKDSYLINKNEDEFNKVAQPKILGTAYLDKCTRHEALDIFVLFSSLAAIFGNVGQCDYSYANSFMDNYAHYREELRKLGQRSGQSISINWPLWEEGGMQIPDIKKEILFEQTGLEVLNTEDGIQAFVRAINSNCPQVLVTVGDRDKIQDTISGQQISVLQIISALDGILVDEKAEMQVPVYEEDRMEQIYTLLKELISEGTKLPVHKIAIDTRFEEYGMDSIMIEHLILKLEKNFGKLSSTLLFEYQSISELVEYLVNKQQQAVKKYLDAKSVSNHKTERLSDSISKIEVALNSKDVKAEDIAIVGLNGVYPKSANMGEFWSNLEKGLDCVTEVPPDRWDWRQYFDEDAGSAHQGKIYCKWGGFVNNAECFDSILFNISPKEAETMDPQERLFLQCVWELMENAGYTREGLAKKYPNGKGADVGVFVGVTTNSYQLLGLEQWEKGNHIVPNSIPWSIPNRISFFFNFNGPSIAVDTACSSSLVAIHNACESLKRKECKIAVVGGVNLYFHPSKYLAMCQLGMLSKEGKCHAFGAKADGFVPGEGVGAILLKPLKTAIEDGDEIWGIIKGTSVNHGGRTNGYKVPSPHSQAMLITKALENAGLSPADIDYIEAHGTGTSLGDPIEIEGLTQAFAGTTVEKQSCPIGSVKTNIGHAESAAGIAGLTKVLLQMKHKKLVPSLHAQQLNKHLDLENTPFYLQRELGEWKNRRPDAPLRAGISSFGAGGVNAHVIVEEFAGPMKPLKEGYETNALSHTGHELLFVFSARNKEQLAELMEKHLEYLLLQKVHMEDLAYTLQTTREEMEERLAFVVSDQASLIEGIRSFLNDLKNSAYTYTGNKNDAVSAGNGVNEKERREETKMLMLGRELHKIASLWVSGRVFDWAGWYEGTERSKLSLPTYPMASKKFWVYPKEQQPLVYLAPDWIEGSLPGQASNETNIMVVGTKKQIPLMEVLEKNHPGKSICRVYLGTRNAEMEQDTFEVNIAEGAPDFTHVRGSKEMDTVYFLGGLSMDSGESFNYRSYQEHQKEGALALIELLKVFGRNITIKVITNQCFKTPNEEPTDYNLFSSTLAGLCKTIPQEYKSVRVIHIDLPVADTESCSLHEGLISSIKETYDEKYPFVAYRDGKRLLRTIKKAELPRAEGEPFMKQGGTYLVLGGTGGIGSYVSKFMVKRYNVKLILIGKSELNSEKQQQINEIKRLGGEVSYYQGDINLPEKTIQLIFDIQKDHGAIDGVIHSAAQVENCLLKDMTPEIYHRVVGTQVLSCLLLKEMTKTLGIRNFIIFSSASSYFGNQGGANYSASNSFKDTYAASLAQDSEIHIKLINWGLWSQVGLGKTYAKVLQQKFRSVVPIQLKDGLKAFDRVINADLMQVVPITASDEFLKAETDYYGQRADTKGYSMPEDRSNLLAVNGQAPLKEQLITLLKNVVGDNLKLDPTSIHVNVHLGDYGMDSIAGVSILKDLDALFGNLPSTLMYEFFTVASLADFLMKEHHQKVESLIRSTPSFEGEKVKNKACEAGCNENKQMVIKEGELDAGRNDMEKRNTQVKNRDIAIVGLNGIYPKAENLKEFWHNLLNKVDCVTEIPADRWDSEAYAKNSQVYGRWGGFINDPDCFDPLFFNISPKEAKGIDPQERLFLQVAYNTFADAGYTKEELSNQKIGVFVGVTNNTYQLIGLENWNNAVDEDIPNSQSWSVPNRVSFIFNLKGPSIPVDTACSSSLSAVHFACESILNGESEMAMAGGVNLYLHPYKYAGLCQMNMLSPTGKCRAFNDEADGFVPGEGVGAMLLKPLEKAMLDGDNIYGIIKGTSVNHGGRTNGYTVPNPNAQAALIEEALKKADINPRSISYIETHGTGTVLGDPIEISGLTMAFRKYTPDKQFCSIGSVKTNIGHLEAGSGIVSITKVLLQMKHKKIAPSLYTEPVNSRINFKETPFYLQPEATDWQRPKVVENGKEIIYPRRASISAFGAGGANAHAIIEEFVPEKTVGPDDEENVILISAKTAEQVITMAKGLLGTVREAHLSGQPGFNLRNVAYTLQTGKDRMEERLAIVTTSLEELMVKLEQFIRGDKTHEGIYYGRAGQTITEDRPGSSEQNRSLNEWAARWVGGYEVNWKTLYKGLNPIKLSLVSYPFLQKKLWLSRGEDAKTAGKTEKTIHPMLHANTSTLNGIRFTAGFSGNEFFIKDHKVNGSSLFPGAGFVEMVMKAALLAADQKTLFLKDITFMRPLAVSGEGVKTEVFIQQQQQNTVFQVQSFQGNKEEKHIQGEIRYFDASVEKMPGADWMKYKEQGQYFNKNQIYDFYNHLGLDYGPSFQCLQELYVAENGLLAELAHNQTVAKTKEDFILHPALLDGALQSIIGFALGSVDNTPCLPFFIGSIKVVDTEKEWKYVHVTKVENSTTKYNIVILEEGGTPLVIIDDFTVRPIRDLNRKNAIETEKTLSVTPEQGGTNDHLIPDLRQKVSGILEFDADEISDDTELGDYGFDSLTFTNLADAINQDYHLTISPALFFEYPTIKTLAAYLRDKCKVQITKAILKDDKPVAEPANSAAEAAAISEETFISVADTVLTSGGTDALHKVDTDFPVAVIGMTGLMPQSADLDEFWTNLIHGENLVTEIPLERWNWREYYGDPIKQKNKTMAKWGGFIKDADKFDARFFNIAAREAELMDPQQRKMLELAWNTIENAGYSISSLSGSKTGVFIGVAANTEYNDLLNKYMEETEAYQSTGVATSILTNRISYMFNWHGPSEPVDTACSSSLVAVHRAIEAMRAGDCEMALAGGTNLILSPRGAISFSKSGMLSPDGSCKTFDKSANGYVRSEGMGLVLLKPLREAELSGDHIYAVILGSAVNHGGKGNSITSPNPNLQAEVIVKAYEKAKIDIETVSYIEAHGTGTQLGDPVEINGLKKAFEILAKQQHKDSIPTYYCGLGSVKTNVGHLETAAGMASLLKVLLSFKHQQIPPNIHFEELNPNISLQDSAFYILNQAQTFRELKESISRGNQPLRASISSFGFGGVNSHIVLEEYSGNQCDREQENKSYMIVLSAKDKERLSLKAEQLANFLEKRFGSFTATNTIALANIQQQLLNEISEILGIAPEDIAMELPFADIGFDKIGLNALAERIEKLYNTQIRIDQILKKETVLNLCRHLSSGMNNMEAVHEEPGYLCSLAYTLQVGRDEMEERACWIVGSISELLRNLREFYISGHTQYNARVVKKNQKVLMIEEDILQNALQQKDYPVLATLWLKGAKPDWKLLYGNKKIQRLELPGYPFCQIRHWFNNKPGITGSTIGINRADRDGYRYMLELDALYYLFDDHAIEDKVILPGAFYFELVDKVIRNHFNREVSFQIANMFWMAPFHFHNEYVNKLYIDFIEGKTLKLKVASITNGQTTEHFQCEVLFDEEKPYAGLVSIQEIQARCSKQINCKDLYAAFRQHGLNYGPMFQTVTDLRCCEDQVVSYMQLKDYLIDQCTFHPSLIDGAFQSVAGMDHSPEDKNSSMVYLPFSLKRFCAYGPVQQSCYAYIQYKGSQKDFIKYDITIINPSGEVAAKIVDFGLKGLPVQQSKATCFIPEYMPVKLSDNSIQSPGSDIIVIDSTDRWKRILPNQERVSWLKPSAGNCKKGEGLYEANFVEPRGMTEVLGEMIRKEMTAVMMIVNLDGFDEMGEHEYAVFFKIFHLTQTLIKKYYHLQIRFTFLFSDKEKNASIKALASYGRTVNLENGNFSFKFIEYDAISDAEMKSEIHDLFSGSYEIRYERGVRYQRQLRELELSGKGMPIRKGGTYVITGGNGGLGQILVKHLLHVYQANVAIISRTALSPRVLKDLKEFERYGGKVYHYQADISDLEDTEKCFAKIKIQLEQIHGIFHLAGVINDSFIFRKTEEDIRRVFDPKIKGIHNLDTVTGSLALELFIVFSSITAITGNKGQADYAYANRYMDEFIHWRNEQTGKGMRNGYSCTINWPLWEQGGMQVNQSTRERLQAENGLTILKDSAGMSILDLILGSGDSQVIPMQGDQKKIKGAFSALNLYSFEKQKLENAISASSHVQQNPASKGSVAKQLPIIENLRKLFSETLKIEASELDIEEDLEAYGFDSLMMVEVLSRLESCCKISVDPSIINQYKTIQNLAQYLAENLELQEPAPEEFLQDGKIPVQEIHTAEVFEKESEQNDKIAVIGMVCRFPQSRNVEEYWENLLHGKDLITEVPKDRWDIDKYYDPEKKRKDSTNSRWGGFIQEVANFDPSFWGIPDDVAMVMDPQHRILLELAEELWSSSGYTKDAIKGKNIGVFIGGAESSYVKSNLDKIPAESMKHIVVNTIQNIMAARISDTYDLVGPSLTLDTACSSSLVSIHEACSQILNGACDMAIAGGIQLLLDPIDHIGMSQAGVLSPEKQSYVFDERAKGIVIGEGAGLVLLKPLQKAIKDGDMIHAVVLGSAINNDGHTMGLTTPNIEGQKAVIKQALKKSGITPDKISYYEAHGTGTLLGDPIEVRAATQIYSEFTGDRQYCGIGSVKANMGHLLRAAGIASFIKVVLSMKKEMMLQTIHCEKPHPRFNFPSSPFFPVIGSKKWEGIDGRKRAAISSFGFGGTNCHMVMEDFSPVQYTGYQLLRYPLGAPQFHKRIYWLGREITDAKDDFYRQLFEKLQKGEINPQEALTLETQVFRKEQE